MSDVPEDMNPKEAAFGHVGGRQKVVDKNTDNTGKHTTGMISEYTFSLRIDGDAPDELVAAIESALADVKAEVESDE